MDPVLAAMLSVVGVSLLSFVGVIFLAFDEARFRRSLIVFVSFSVGALLGDVFIHMLPEIGRDPGFTLSASLTILAGFLFSFIVEKFIHWHHCHDEDCEAHHEAHDCHDAHDEAHGHAHGAHHLHHAGVKPFAILSIIGEAVHNFIDGVIIAAAYLASMELGLATTLAVVFHEIPHELGNFALLLHGGFTRWKAVLYNALAALFAILGAVVTILVSESVATIAPYLLPFAAGTFLYIAGTDIIPELHKEEKTSRNVGQFVAILCGVAVMGLLLLVG